MFGHYDDEIVKESYKDWFQTKAGKVVLDDLCVQAQMNSSPFDPNSPRSTDFFCGKQELVYYIFNMIDTSLQKEIENTYGREDV